LQCIAPMPFARGATAFGPPPLPWGQRDKEYMGQWTIGQWTMRQWTMGHWGNRIRRTGQGDNAQWDFGRLSSRKLKPGDQTHRVAVRSHHKWMLWERATSSNISCLTLCPRCKPPLRPPACLRLSTMEALGAGYFIELLRQTHSCPPRNPPSYMRGS
jgi:hypothetical protein